MSRNKQLEPARFCKNDGVETGIRVREGYDLCLDCYREYLAARSRPTTDEEGSAAAFKVDLFGRAAA